VSIEPTGWQIHRRTRNLYSSCVFWGRWEASRARSHGIASTRLRWE
jgi:hypothetical protein